MQKHRARNLLKRAVAYTPKHPELVRQLESIRSAFESAPIVPPYVGDAIYDAIVEGRFTKCLEVGMATGSTAAYMLKAIEQLGGGEVVSIDRAQSTFYRSIGVRTVEQTGLGRWHRLIEDDSIVSLFELWRSGARFGFVFMDGWKTFDHLAVELYFVARLLVAGGLVVFDDLPMPSVQHAIRLLEGHYEMKRVDLIPRGAIPELAAKAALQVVAQPRRIGAARATLQGAIGALRKTREPNELPVTKDWTFFAPLVP